MAYLPNGDLKDVVEYTSNGSFVKANYPNIKKVRVLVVGGGGGGGGANSVTRAAQGACGGAGGYSIRLIPASLLGASVPVTVGASGSFGTATPAGTGGNGGTSSFGAFLQATGGFGGAGMLSTGGEPIPVTGGVGGTGSGGDINDRGGDGSSGIVRVGFFGYTAATGAGSLAALQAEIMDWPVGNGQGGASIMGGGGRQALPQAAGQDGRAYGSGAGGGSGVAGSDFAGGTGAQGIVIVEVYA